MGPAEAAGMNLLIGVLRNGLVTNRDGLEGALRGRVRAAGLLDGWFGSAGPSGIRNGLPLGGRAVWLIRNHLPGLRRTATDPQSRLSPWRVSVNYRDRHLLLERIIHGTPAGVKARKITDHRKVTYNRAMDRRKGQCLVHVGKDIVVTINYIVSWGDPNKTQFIVQSVQ
jgi:hypothetical protein